MATLGPWEKGMNNRSPEHDIGIGTATDPRKDARNAVNVDFSNNGKGRRRKGATKVYAGMGTKGGFSCEVGVFFIEGMHLKMLNPDNTATTIYNGITGKTFAYDYFNGVVYFSDCILNLKITDGVAVKWGMSIPGAPVLTTTTGAYGSGVYLAAVCWVDANGVESGASKITSISADDDSGIVFYALPASSDPQVVAKRLYLSTPNGHELYHVADVSTGTTSHTILDGRYDEGNILDNHFVSPPPPCRAITHYNGRMYVADEYGTVYYSNEFSFDQFKLGESFIQFPLPVDIMLPIGNGIIFAFGEQTDLYSGNPEDGFTISKCLPYGAIYGTGALLSSESKIIWMSQKGVIVCDRDGTCVNIQEDKVATESGDSGALIVREEDGIKQVIVTIKNPNTSRLAATSFIEAEITRRSE